MSLPPEKLSALQHHLRRIGEKDQVKARMKDPEVGISQLPSPEIMQGMAPRGKIRGLWEEMWIGVGRRVKGRRRRIDEHFDRHPVDMGRTAHLYILPGIYGLFSGAMSFVAVCIVGYNTQTDAKISAIAGLISGGLVGIGLGLISSEHTRRSFYSKNSNNDGELSR